MPIARFCVRHSVKVQDAIECLKIELIEESKRELTRRGTKVSQSHLSVLTGLRRREVIRLDAGEVRLEGNRTMIMKVLGLWRENKKYLTKSGVPRVLTFGTAESEFAKLVQEVSSDLNPATVLFELERVDAISRTPRGVMLLKHNYLPSSSDPSAGFQILSQDITDLTYAVESNLLEGTPLPHHHLRTEYDRVRPESVEKIKQWLLKEGHHFHLRARDEISKYDQDSNPDPHFSGKAVRVVLGSYGVTIEEE